ACQQVDPQNQTEAASMQAANTQATNAPVSQPQDNPVAPTGIRIVIVSHGNPAGSGFWSVVKRGADKAAEHTGVTVDFKAPETFDVAAMAQLIDEAVATKPDGLVVSIPDADTLGPSIKAAIDAEIPVISMNSGSEAAAKLGELTHVGQSEYEAGFKAGQRLAQAGVRHGFCVNHEVGNAALTLRCEGFVDALLRVDGTVDPLAIDMTDPAEAKKRVKMALEAMPQVDGILVVGSDAAMSTLEALKETESLSRVKLATFDLSPDILAAIEGGKILFAVDQQQYLQGYLPVMMLSLYLTNANTPAAEVFPTGPGFVTRKNAAKVIELSGTGTR
ncbi:sugar ABC transporter substrate-binding protein, partial [Chloroflexota bacterium]